MKVTPESRRNGTPTSPPYTDGRPTRERIGQLAHKVIEELAAAGATSPDFRTIAEATGRHPEVRANTGRLGGARQQVLCTVNTYFRFFGPEAGWELVGAERTLDGCRLDLLWRDGDGLLVADEIKTGRLDGRLQQERAREQASRIFAACHAKFDDEFAELRVCVLGAPRQSFVVREGTTSDFFEEVIA